MAEIRAFRAFRYDLGRVGALSDVTAPPYDVIDATLQQRLYDRSPFNVIRLILNKPEPGDGDDSRYQRAAGFVRDWQREHVLVQDSARCLYVYHQEFEIEGQKHTRRGFFARVRLEPFGAGPIFPHEETMSGPKADRLKLFRATQMNLSPVFGLYPDAEHTVQTLLDNAIRRVLPLEATDHLGVVSRLWPVSDQQVVSAVAGAMSPHPIFIADGHHRYETALQYRHERQQAGEVPDAEAAPNFVLMMLVSMSDDGLVILPTHRLVSGVGNLTSPQLAQALGSHFDMHTVGQGDAAARETWQIIEADGSQNILGFGTVADGIWQTARLRSDGAMTELAPEHSPSWRSLAVSVLHVLILNRVLKRQQPPECRYVHLLSEATAAVAQRSCELAVLVPPATMGHMETIAGNFEKMPPKSTYFYPKVMSGLVFNSLKGH
jgi:uncharacterized protein (DUF1015 family)